MLVGSKERLEVLRHFVHFHKFGTRLSPKNVVLNMVLLVVRLIFSVVKVRSIIVAIVDMHQNY